MILHELWPRGWRNSGFPVNTVLREIALWIVNCTRVIHVAIKIAREQLVKLGIRKRVKVARGSIEWRKVKNSRTPRVFRFSLIFFPPSIFSSFRKSSNEISTKQEKRGNPGNFAVSPSSEGLEKAFKSPSTLQRAVEEEKRKKRDLTGHRDE